MASARTRRYGVLTPGRAGDFILITGLLNVLKAHDPSAELTVVVGPRAAEMARRHPAVDRVLLFDRHPLKLLPFLFRLRDRVFDVWIDPKDHFSRSQSLVARATRASLKIGFNRPGGGAFDRPLIPVDRPRYHWVDMMMAPLATLGIGWDGPPPLSLGLPEGSVVRAEHLLRHRVPLEVLVNLSAGARARYWSEEKWREFLAQGAEIGPTRFWLSASPEDGALAGRILAEGRAAGANVVGIPAGSLLDLAAVVQRVDLVVSMDTSIIHLAAVYDRPVLGLYTIAEPNFTRFRPLSTVQEVVQGERIGDIPVPEIVAAYQRLLARR
ncbi:MAG: glycosyltransferase family 9 protein [Gemmatimonadales bacterium]